ncbi:hypothetical protein [Cohnella panacarvi]|uniref:hypothetical protein n=1 Tax=Cohnella panacarvi TaxID=400776 RepID=UPI0004786D9E|nr:hypothetical protein [Cohnella panacarvi]
MIFGASIGPFLKKALGDRAFQASVAKLAETLHLPQEQSGMDAVVLGPKDARGTGAKALLEAVERKHASIAVIYVYQKDKEAELISGDVIKLHVPALLPETIGDAVAGTIDLSKVGTDDRTLESTDAKYGDRNWQEKQAADETAASAEPVVPVADEPPPERELPKSLEQRLLELGRFADYQFFKEALEQDNLLKDLHEQNAQYAAVVRMLDALDADIERVFLDGTLSVEERFERVKGIGIERAAYAGLEHSLIADKLISLMDAIVVSAVATVDSRIERIRQALGAVTDGKLLHEEFELLQERVDARIAIQADLMEMSREIIELYKAMDRSVSEWVERMESSSASGIAIVNETMREAEPYFVPQNIAAVTSRLIGDLQRRRVSMSIAEEKIRKLIELVFRLCEEDATIIEHQQRLIRLLRAQRIEDVVVVDNLIKHALRLFVGPPESGRTATALTWAGVMSRRHNSLLIDLTGQSKARHYGVEPVSLNRFLADRIERPFVCVEGTLAAAEEAVFEFVIELKRRLHYYPYATVLLDAGQTDLMNLLAKSALTVHFVSDCSPRSTERLKETIEAFEERNIATKVVLIDPPLDPFRHMSDLNADPLRSKLVLLPRLNEMRICALQNKRPYEQHEIAGIYEEAFR